LFGLNGYVARARRPTHPAKNGDGLTCVRADPLNILDNVRSVTRKSLPAYSLAQEVGRVVVAKSVTKGKSLPRLRDSASIAGVCPPIRSNKTISRAARPPLPEVEGPVDDAVIRVKNTGAQRHSVDRSRIATRGVEDRVCAELGH
jgi:hypothetical protein